MIDLPFGIASCNPCRLLHSCQADLLRDIGALRLTNNRKNLGLARDYFWSTMICELSSLRSQLECWNARIVESWVLEQWYDGSEEKRIKTHKIVLIFS
jgi:hypothetical protein